MRIKISDLADSHLVNADIVTAVDSGIPSYSQQLFGQESVPTGRMPNAPALQLNSLEVEINSSDENQLENLVSRLETAKGSRP